ncbi:hypothetical protein PoB_002563800 [Plakobranchus ocellatus]|uniref:Uncharacterized protein n=1 Tax=Plakobranchus ocellatus TaxID=259542 RepID=A0AAV3ZXG0_9GAST|nr:hypothetical protein PoB_002563800 [Plakobranchus ocellatus]
MEASAQIVQRDSPVTNSLSLMVNVSLPQWVNPEEMYKLDIEGKPLAGLRHFSCPVLSQSEQHALDWTPINRSEVKAVETARLSIVGWCIVP